MIKLFNYQKTKPTTKHCALYWQMGTGKTFGSMFKADCYGDNQRLIVCQKSKINDWVDDLHKYYDSNITVCDLTKKQEKATYYVINYDLVWRRDLSFLNDFTLILDESSEVRHRTTKKTKAVLKLGKLSNHNILLSGTPSGGGKYELLLTQLNLLGWNITESEFYDKYCNWFYNYKITGFPLKQITSYKNIETDLLPKMKSLGCEFLKTYHDLPDQVEKTVHTKPLKEYFTFAKKSIVTINDNEYIGETTLTQLLYERQILAMSKKQEVLDLVNSTDKRLIIFYNFNLELEILTNLLSVRPLSFVNGRERDLTNYELYSNSITLVQYQAGAKGLNLQKAQYMIFHTPPLSAELYAQAKKRTHRVGQTKTCFYYKLVAKDSVEEKIYANLERGIDYELRLFEKERRPVHILS